MKIPQLVQEIIDYYLYFGQWKARVTQLNEEYNAEFHLIDEINIIFNKKGEFAYNWRRILSCFEQANGWKVYRVKDIIESNQSVSLLPDRYIYSNTKEQLKSLYF